MKNILMFILLFFSTLLYVTKLYAQSYIHESSLPINYNKIELFGGIYGGIPGTFGIKIGFNHYDEDLEDLAFDYNPRSPYLWHSIPVTYGFDISFQKFNTVAMGMELQLDLEYPYDDKYFKYNDVYVYSLNYAISWDRQGIISVGIGAITYNYELSNNETFYYSTIESKTYFQFTTGGGLGTVYIDITDTDKLFWEVFRFNFSTSFNIGKAPWGFVWSVYTGINYAFWIPTKE